MEDKIDERDRQEKSRRSIIKGYNVHYITREEMEAQNAALLAAKQAAAQEETEAEKVANEICRRLQEEAMEDEVKKQEELQKLYADQGNELSSAGYGKNPADEETLNKMKEILKDREAAVKEIMGE